MSFGLAVSTEENPLFIGLQLFSKVFYSHYFLFRLPSKMPSAEQNRYFLTTVQTLLAKEEMQAMSLSLVPSWFTFACMLDRDLMNIFLVSYLKNMWYWVFFQKK